MRSRLDPDKARKAHGIVSAALVVFFALHGIMGSASVTFGLQSPLKALAWAGAALVLVHVALSAVVTSQMLKDTVRPPSERKKRHQMLKWATGGALALCICAHIAYTVVLGRPAATAGFSAFATMLLLVAALAAHECVGSKSLLKDLNVDRRHRTAFRVAVVVLAVLFGIAMISRL